MGHNFWEVQHKRQFYFNKSFIITRKMLWIFILESVRVVYRQPRVLFLGLNWSIELNSKLPERKISFHNILLNGENLLKYCPKKRWWWKENKNRGVVETALKKSRLLTMSNSEQCEIQRRRCKGRLTSSHSRLCAYNSELQWKLKPPSALGYLITPNFRTLRVFPLQVLTSSCLP